MEMTCSNKPRPSVHKGAKTGQHWLRNVHHIKAGDKTLCGRNASEWLTFEANIDAPDLCKRCAASNSGGGDPPPLPAGSLMHPAVKP